MPRIPAKGKSKILSSVSNVVGPKQTSLMAFVTSSPKSNLSISAHVANEVKKETEPVIPEKKLEEDSVLSHSDNETSCSPSKAKRIKLDSQTPSQDSRDQKIRERLIHQSSLLNILDMNMGTTWFKALENNFSKEYFSKLNRFVTSSRVRGSVYPTPDNVWQWTKHCPIQDVKVVILGQDPYHGPNQAHGLCFSVKKGVPLPPSLLNMYKELEQEKIGFVRPNHGCLTGWAEQGVLLLNAVLTVDAHKPNSHKDQGWEKVTDSVISWISGNLNSVVFLLWGAYAQKKAAMVDKNKHHLLQCTHPSPLSASKGFFGSNHFAKCNELLEESGKEPIDWAYLP